MKKIEDFKPVNCDISEMEYVIVRTYDNSVLDVGFRYTNQANKYLENLIAEMKEFDVDNQDDDEEDYKVVHISEIVKEKIDWGQTIIIVAAIIFALSVLTHLF